MRASIVCVALPLLAGCQPEPAPAPVASPTPAAAAPRQPPIRQAPGLWDMMRRTASIEMPGAPPPLAAEIRRRMLAERPVRQQQCLSAADVARGPLDPMQSLQPGERCTVLRNEQSGSDYVGELVCRNGGAGTNRIVVRGRIERDRIVLLAASRITGAQLPGELRSRLWIAGVRRGDCPTTPPNEGTAR